MATVDFEDCVVCQESLVDKMFPLFTTTTLSTQSLLAYKLNELLGLECLSGCCCRHCHDLVEQIDFFQQNMKGYPDGSFLNSPTLLIYLSYYFSTFSLHTKKTAKNYIY